MERSTRLDLPLLLPEVQDARDACVARLVRLLQRRPGVARVHVVEAGQPVPADDAAPAAAGAAREIATESQLCLHYDPERLTITQVSALARLAGAEVTDRFGHVVIPVRMVGTEDDDRRVAAGLCALPGVTTAAVSVAGQVARVEYDCRRIDRAAIEAELRELGAHPTADQEVATPAVPRADTEHGKPGHVHDAATDAGWYSRNRELAWSLIAGVLLAAGWLLGRTGLSPLVPIAFYVGSYFFGARDNVGHFLKDLGKGRFQFNIDLLMVVAAVGAAVLGEWLEGALLLFLFSLGHALEHYALGRARNAIAALAELAPTRAIVLRDEGGTQREVTVAIEEVKKGDRVVVKPAERIPVDGTVAEGRSGVNQAPITGESVPVDKTPGQPVFAGSVNGEGALVIEVTAAIGDRTLDRVVKLVAEAQTQKAPTQQFTDRFERIFVPLVLVADALLIVVPPLLGIWTWSDSFYRAMALLVAASPCALALGTPAAVLAGVAQAARRGVLIKGGAHLEALGSIRVLALDKTGTITKGEPAVTDVVPTQGTTEDDLLAATAAVERRSQHPLARAIMSAAEARRLPIPDAGEVQSVTARGVRGPVGDSTVEVGRMLMFEESGATLPDEISTSVARLEANGRSTMVTRRFRAGAAANDGWLGVIGIAD